MPTSTQRFRLVGDDDASKTFLEVAAAARLLKTNMDDVGSSVLGLGKLSGGASLVPVLAATTAATVELTTALGAAAGAGGVFGLSVVGQVKSMVEQRKAIASTEKSLGSLEKGTDTYRDTLTKLHEQQKSFNQDFGPAAKGLDQMSSAWDGFLEKTSPVTNGVLAKGFDLVSDALPKLVPVSNAAGEAVGGLIDDLDGWVNGPGFAHLLHFLETSGPKDITAFGHSIGNVLGGLGGILSNFVGPGNHAARTLEHLTENFDEWGNSKGVSDSVDRFLRYVNDNGPEITAALKGIADASPKIASSLGKLGSANLSATSKFINLVAGLPQGAFDVVVTGLFGIAAASKLIAAGAGLKALATGLGGVVGGKGLTGKATGGILSGGVQKVFVVNMGAGGLGGPGTGVPGGSPGSQLARSLPLIGTAITAGIISKQFAENERENNLRRFGTNDLVKVAVVKLDRSLQARGIDTDALRARGTQTVKVGPFEFEIPKALKSTGTAVDALRERLGKASQAMELVGHSADRAFPGATRQVTTLSGKMAAIDGGKASAALDLVGHSAATNFARAGGDADTFKGKLNSIPSSKTVKVAADTGQALSGIQRIIAGLAAIHDKTVHVTTLTNANVADALRKGSGSGSGGSGSGGSGSGAQGDAADAGQKVGLAFTLGIAAGIESGTRKALEAAQNVVRSAIQSTRSDAQQLSSTVSSNFRSDIFGATSVWGGSGGPIATLKLDIANAKAFNKTLHRLAQEGVSGSALAAIAASGNLQGAQTLAANKATALQFQRLFRERQRESAATGRFAADQLHKKLDEEIRLLHSIDQRLKHLPKDTGKETAKGVNSGVANGQRRRRRHP